jgi:GT2 family glycosyltransferase
VSPSRPDGGLIGVSVVTYRSSMPMLRLTLAAVAASAGVDLRLRVHANAASAADAADLHRLVSELGLSAVTEVTWSATNHGFAGAHNVSLAALFGGGCSAVVVLNPDLALAPDALTSLSSCAAAAGRRALVGPLLELAEPATLDGTGLVDTLGIRWTRDGRHLDTGQGRALPAFGGAARRVEGISGACLFVTREAHDAVVDASGEFFDADFIAYREDAELAWRASLLGIPSLLCPAARGRHARRLRGTLRGVDPHIDRLGVRNRFLIAFKYGAWRPGGWAGPWLRDLVVIFAVLLQERSSYAGLRDAWRLRGVMRAKGRLVATAAQGRAPRSSRQVAQSGSKPAARAA